MHPNLGNYVLSILVAIAFLYTTTLNPYLAGFVFGMMVAMLASFKIDHPLFYVLWIVFMLGWVLINVQFSYAIAMISMLFGLLDEAYETLFNRLVLPLSFILFGLLTGNWLLFLFILLFDIGYQTAEYFMGSAPKKE